MSFQDTEGQYTTKNSGAYICFPVHLLTILFYIQPLNLCTPAHSKPTKSSCRPNMSCLLVLFLIMWCAKGSNYEYRPLEIHSCLFMLQTLLRGLQLVNNTLQLEIPHISHFIKVPICLRLLKIPVGTIHQCPNFGRDMSLQSIPKSTPMCLTEEPLLSKLKYVRYNRGWLVRLTGLSVLSEGKRFDYETTCGVHCYLLSFTQRRVSAILRIGHHGLL